VPPWLLPLLPLAGGAFLGWALGANDAAHVFGTAVGSRIIRLRTANAMCAACVMLGAALQGERGMATLSGLTEQTTVTLLIVSLSAGGTITVMTLLGLPISTSQAIVGAIAGVGIATRSLNTGGLVRIVICWFATPVGAMIVSFVIYKLLHLAMHRFPMSMLTRDSLLLAGLVVVSAYGSYALGANNVANATGIFSGQIPGLSDFHLALIGGASIALGVLTFSKRVILAVGGGLMRLNAYTALVAVSSMAVTVHVFAIIGVPVSTGQGIVGGILGVGLVQGFHAFEFRALRRFVVGWVLTPLSAFVLSAAGYAIFGVH
jgi:inorganic phosphate transporter, PiT family